MTPATFTEIVTAIIPSKMYKHKCDTCGLDFSVFALRRQVNLDFIEKAYHIVEQLPDYCPGCGNKLANKKEENHVRVTKRGRKI